MNSIKSDALTEKLDSVVKGSAGFVIFFGVFTSFCLILQCLDGILALLHTEYAFFNKNFIIPINTLTTLYATLCASYIGLDRGASVISTIKGVKNHQDYGQANINRHIIFQIFFICMLALGLNRFFDANLGLEALMISFGSSVIFYVSGQKLIFASSKFAPEDKNNNGIDDRIENDKELIKVLNRAVTEGKTFKIFIKDLSGKDSLVYTSDKNDTSGISSCSSYPSYPKFSNKYGNHQSKPNNRFDDDEPKIID